MINVSCRNNKIIYNAYHLVKAFMPEAVVASSVDENQSAGICVSIDGNIINAEDIRELYTALCKLTEKDLPWGMLTGVRPVKLASKWLRDNNDGTKEAFVKWFYEDRSVSREKAELAYDVALKERGILSRMFSKDDPEDRGYSLYIGIPFCPTVCSYCSFSSGSISEYKDRTDKYLEALFAEMKQKADEYAITEKGFRYPTTVYIGGGTPVSLSEEQLEELFNRADELFRIKEGLNAGKIFEYTVEAGRPDSITAGKLEVIKRAGAGRISVNPQSMQQKTLDIIGRKHTVKQTEEAFYLARDMGFDNINMDIIAGLPGENEEDMLDTLRRIKELGPDSLTVHCLAVKRASAIGIEKKLGAGSEYKAGECKDAECKAGECKADECKAGECKASKEISRMIEAAGKAASDMGMEPYYLYRQKSIAGNFENTGYAKPGKEGLYNILIMEEIQSIIACGAAASNKIVVPKPVPNPARGGKMTEMIRSENVKNIDEYISRYTDN